MGLIVSKALRSAPILQFNSQEITDVIKEMKTVSECFLVAKPNAGIPKTVDGKTTYEVSQAEIANASLDWIAAGARIVGGCCGAGPDHIARIADAVKID